VTRNQFYDAFSRPANASLRLAHLMLALRAGPSWSTWSANVNSAAPSYYNEIMFLQCYVFFMLKPTRRKLLALNGFFTKRNGSDKGLAIDPIHLAGGTRKDIVALLLTAMKDFNATHEMNEQGVKVHKAMGLIDTGKLAYTGEAKAFAFRTTMLSVVSEMWLPGGALRTYLTHVVGDLSHNDIERQCGSNLNTALADASKKQWLSSMVEKFEGRSMSRSMGTPPYDVMELAVTSPSFRNRVVGD